MSEVYTIFVLIKRVESKKRQISRLFYERKKASNGINLRRNGENFEKKGKSIKKGA